MGALIVVVLAIAIAAVVAIVVYLRRRLVLDPFPQGPRQRLGGRVLIGSVVVTFGTILVPRIVPGSPVARVAVAGYVMLAVFFYLALTLAVAELPRWAIRRRSRSSDPTSPEPATVARVIAAASVAIAVVTTAVGFFEARDIAVKEVSVPMTRPDPAVDGLRIAVLTDIHLTVGLRDRAWMAEVVKRVNELEPDLVAIVGDLVDGDVEHLGDDAAPLAELESTHGTVFVTGNHEFISGATQWVDFLPTLGIRVLRNEHFEIDRNGSTFVVAGVDDVTGDASGSGPDIPSAVEGTSADHTVILLSHQPVLAGEARDNEVDLQISGHTHGGQMWPIHLLVQLQQGHVAGLERVGDMALYTSRGVGSWGPPVRVGAPPEIAVLTLQAG